LIRNETFRDGVCIYAQVVDLDAETLTVEERGTVVSSRSLTPDEVEAFRPKHDPRESAVAKLQALGLTEAEASALIGG
jgi:hypothetical protein